jgi:hypothetical protein
MGIISAKTESVWAICTPDSSREQALNLLMDASRPDIIAKHGA